MKRLLLIITICIASNSVFAQKQTIYYLTDSTEKINGKKAVEFGAEGTLHFYRIFEKLYAGSKRDIAFTYNKTKATKSASKPSHKYLTRKGLVDLVHKEGHDFNEKYNLSVVEVMPKKSYHTKKVHLVWIDDKPVY